MPDKVKIILSTYGGRLDGQAKIALVEKAMQSIGLAYDLEPTEHQAHGLDLAKRAAQEGWPVIVAAGGDGTINEVINGLMQTEGEYRSSTLGVIPLGTGNDLAHSLSLPSNVEAACRRIAAGNTRLIDLGIVNGRYFANNSAVGLEPVITLAHEELRWVNGNLRYALAAVKGIAGAKFWNVRLQWDHGIFEGPVTLVSVGNGRRTGGLFYMTPQAELDDGWLDFVYASNLSRWQMMRLLPKTFSGTHINNSLVTYLRTKKLSVTSSPSTPIQADGEVIDKTAVEINYEIAPKKLRVLV